jgi:hypothetical protein
LRDRHAASARLRDVVLKNVEPGSVVSTDELMSYGLLAGDGFVHGSVKHGAKEWSYYDYRMGEIIHIRQSTILQPSSGTTLGASGDDGR